MQPVYQSPLVTLFHADCFEWLESELSRHHGQPWLHAVVTDPPFGVVEFTQAQLDKMEAGSGGVWRIPPSFDGHVRRPLPRFTVLLEKEQQDIYDFFHRLALALLPALHPGAHILIASNILLTHIVDNALTNAGLEKRATLVRLVQTLRGGDRPKLADKEFPEVSVMPRGGWEPWSVFRKPLLPGERVSASLRTRGTGALRRPSLDTPFGDVIPSVRTPKRERELAPHPSLKPQQFMRYIVRAALPLGTGVVYDPFTGGGSTLAAAQALGYHAVGTEVNAKFASQAARAIPRLAALEVTSVDGIPRNVPRRAANGRAATRRTRPKSGRDQGKVLPFVGADGLWVEAAEAERAQP
jgi:site-specific DNA-methyltransferase (adenine-specific)